jgi:tetratricopeptide (TPR) repeat protein
MSNRRNVTSAGFIPASQKPAIIPGLGGDVPELQQTRALWQTNRFDEALALFEKAVRKYPQNLVALVDASRAFGARFEITRAEELLDRLTKVAAGNSQVLHRPAKLPHDFPSGKALMFRTCPGENGKCGCQFELAVLAERRHPRLSAFADRGACVAQLSGGGTVQRAATPVKDTAGAEALFRRLATDDTAHPQVRARPGPARAGTGPGGRLRRSHDTMLKAGINGRRRSAVAPGIKQLGDISDRRGLTRSISSGGPRPKSNLAQRWSCGWVPRSGTTLLEQVLDSHPGPGQLG